MFDRSLPRRERGPFRPARPSARPERALHQAAHPPATHPATASSTAMPPTAATPARPAQPPTAPLSGAPAVPDTTPAPPEMQSFDELSLSPGVRDAVAQMGISVPTPIQAGAIPPLLAGRDVIGQARTGSGKTLAFALPLVERCDPARRGVQAVVLVPTRELAIQVGDVVRPLADARRLKLTLLYGGRSLGPDRQALMTGAQIVVATPGRALDHLRQNNLNLHYLKVFVLDESDEMLDRGFAPDVERILGFTPNDRQTALFSATVPDWVLGTAARHLHDPVTVRVDSTGEAPPEIEHVVHELPADLKLEALCDLLDRRGDGPAIVFGRTKHGVKKLAKKLQSLGYPAEALQGNLSQNARERVMAGFRSGDVPILVATNVAARGIDVTGIEVVINFEVPESAELFTHRVGRTGRMGRQGMAITLVSPDETQKMREIERFLKKQLPREPWAPTPGRSARATTPAPAIATPRPSAPGTSAPGTPASASPAPRSRAVRAEAGAPRDSRRLWRQAGTGDGASRGRPVSHVSPASEELDGQRRMGRGSPGRYQFSRPDASSRPDAERRDGGRQGDGRGSSGRRDDGRPTEVRRDGERSVVDGRRGIDGRSAGQQRGSRADDRRERATDAAATSQSPRQRPAQAPADEAVADRSSKPWWRRRQSAGRRP